MTAAFEDGLLLATARRVPREETHRDGVVALGRKLDPVVREFGRKKGMRDVEENARAVARTRVATGRAAVREVRKDFEPLLDDFVRGLAAERGDEAKPAGVVLERRIVEALTAR